MTQAHVAFAFWSMIPFAPWLVCHAPTSMRRLLLVTALICELPQRPKSFTKDKFGKGRRKERAMNLKYRARW